MESPEIKNPIYTLDWDRYYPVAEKFSIELFNGKFFYVNYKKTEPLVSSFKIYSDGILYAKYHNVEDEFEYKDYNELRRGIFKVIEELKLDIDKIYIIDAEFCHLSSFKKAVKENRAILIGNYFVDRISDLKLKYTLVPYMVERMKKDIYYISKIFSDFKIWIQIERKNSFAKLCFLFPNHKKDYRDFAKAIEQLNLWQHICEKNPKVVELHDKLDKLFAVVLETYPLFQYFYTLIFNSDKKSEDLSDEVSDKIIEYINAMDAYRESVQT